MNRKVMKAVGKIIYNCIEKPRKSKGTGKSGSATAHRNLKADFSDKSGFSDFLDFVERFCLGKFVLILSNLIVIIVRNTVPFQ